MIKLFIQSYLIILTIPFITYALDPKEPKTICDRLVAETAKNSCLEIVTKNTLDWYAAAACNALDDDSSFLKCWKEIAGGKFNPETLAFCTRNTDDTDSDKLKCILSMKNKSFSINNLRKCDSTKNSSEFQKCFELHRGRAPASDNSEFQSHETNKKKGN